MSHKIALIHATRVAIDPVRDAMQKGWPECRLVNLLDDSLSADRAAQQGELSESLTERIVDIAGYATKLEADGILFTCSAFGTAIDKAASNAAIPVLKPNEAMFQQALLQGDRIAMLYTFEPARDGMEQEFKAMIPAGRTRASISSYHVPGAMEALRNNDSRTHDRLVAMKAARLKGVDVIMLAHFSTTGAASAVRQVVDVPVLTSPDCAVSRLRALVEGASAEAPVA